MTVTQFFNCLFKITIGVQNMHQIEIASVSEKILNQKFTNKIELSDNANIQKIFGTKI